MNNPEAYAPKGQMTELDSNQGSYLDSNTFDTESAKLARLDNGLLDVVFTAGSTANPDGWRTTQTHNEHNLLTNLTAAGINCYNPQMDEWEYNHIEVEARAMEKASVVAVYIENYGQDGSLGSLAEVAVGVPSAVFRGQEIIICIEPDYIESLQDPAARAQYQALIVKLRDLGQRYSNITLIEDATKEDYLKKVIECTDKQRRQSNPQIDSTSKKYQDFIAKRSNRLNNTSIKIVNGGSSASAIQTKSSRVEFLQKQQFQTELAKQLNGEVTTLYQRYQDAWDTAYQITDPAQQATEFKRLLRLEDEHKKQADLILWGLLAESRSHAATMEAAFFILQAFEEGQTLVLLNEDFAVDEYLKAELIANEAKLRSQFSDDASVIKLLVNLTTEEEIYRMAKKTSLKKHQVFLRADNTRRVREIFKKQLQNLKKTMQTQGIDDIFYLANDQQELSKRISELTNIRSAA